VKTITETLKMKTITETLKAIKINLLGIKVFRIKVVTSPCSGGIAWIF